MKVQLEKVRLIQSRMSAKTLQSGFFAYSSLLETQRYSMPQS